MRSERARRGAACVGERSPGRRGGNTASVPLSAGRAARLGRVDPPFGPCAAVELEQPETVEERAASAVDDAERARVVPPAQPLDRNVPVPVQHQVAQAAKSVDELRSALELGRIRPSEAGGEALEEILAG